MATREVISLNIGQAGVQMGTSFWELILLEHCVDADGFSMLQDDNNYMIENFFEDVDSNRFTPRAIFLDSEPNVIDEIKTGVYRKLFHPDQLLSGNADGANNFARGSFAIGKTHLGAMIEKIRRTIEECYKPQGFLINHSLSGGTGSGLTSVLVHALHDEYHKLAKIQLPVFPGVSLASAIVEPYNCTFHVHTTMDNTDMIVLFDNESLYQVCVKFLHMYSPNFTNINRIMALAGSSITASFRFEGSLNSCLSNMLTNLIPYPRIHFPIVSHVPLMHVSRISHEVITTKQLLKNIFDKDHLLMQCNLNKAFYISVMLNGRGPISPVELSDGLLQLKLKTGFNFVDWSPRGFKLCLNSQTPSVVPDSEIAFSDKALTLICNSTAIRECWTPLENRFDLLFEKRAFVHWYIDEGMEETEFFEARLDLDTLNKDYCEISSGVENISLPSSEDLDV